MPHGLDCEDHITRSNKGIKYKKQKVSLVLEAHAVVDPRTVMVHQEHTPVASPAVMSPSWFDFLTLFALFCPKTL